MAAARADPIRRPTRSSSKLARVPQLSLDPGDRQRARLDDPAPPDHGRRRGAAGRSVAGRWRQRLAVRRPRHRPLLRRRAGTPGDAAGGPRAPHPVRRRGPELRHAAPSAGRWPRAASSPSRPASRPSTSTASAANCSARIRANVATMMLLQPSADDARLLRDEMAPLTERDLLNLPRYRMAVRTEFDGQARVLTADVLPEVPSLGSAGLVRRLSNARDAQATVDVNRVTTVSRPTPRSRPRPQPPYTTVGRR